MITATYKKAEQADYAAICQELEFDPSSHFVKIARAGSISFTTGRPEECRALVYSAWKAGYSIAPALNKACRW